MAGAQPLRDRVLVDGATGYLGTHLTDSLLRGGCAVRCLVHPHANRTDVELLRKMGAEVVVGSLDQSDESSPVLQKAFEDVQAAVHLIGSIAPKKGESFSNLHKGQTEWFLHHARGGGVAKLILITALGTGVGAKSKYHASKWEAEELVRQSGLPYVILRPSLIVGRLVGRRNSKLVMRYMELLAGKPFVPLIAGGHNKIQPVFVGDLCQAILRTVSSDFHAAMQGKALEVGGAEVVEMRKLVQMLMEVINIRKPLLNVPVAMMRCVAMCCEVTQTVPTVSSDQVTLSLSDNVCSENAIFSMLGNPPTPLQIALQTYGDHRNPVSTGATT